MKLFQLSAGPRFAILLAMGKRPLLSWCILIFSGGVLFNALTGAATHSAEAAAFVSPLYHAKPYHISERCVGRIRQKSQQFGGIWDHTGIDLKVEKFGAPVSAIADGVVLFAGYQHSPSGKSWGNVVLILHKDGLISLYAHLTTASIRQLNLRVNQKVVAGQTIGAVGNTGVSVGRQHFSLELRHLNYPTEKLVFQKWRGKGRDGHRLFDTTGAVLTSYFQLPKVDPYSMPELKQEIYGNASGMPVKCTTISEGARTTYQYVHSRYLAGTLGRLPEKRFSRTASAQ